MTIKLWFGHKKYVVKKWVREHKPHIIATVSLALLTAITVYLSSQALANFLDKEFIQPSIAQELSLKK